MLASASKFDPSCTPFLNRPRLSLGQPQWDFLHDPAGGIFDTDAESDSDSDSVADWCCDDTGSGESDGGGSVPAETLGDSGVGDGDATCDAREFSDSLLNSSLRSTVVLKSPACSFDGYWERKLL